MPINRQKSSQCIFCAFRLASRPSTSTSSRARSTRIRQDARAFSTTPSRAFEDDDQLEEGGFKIRKQFRKGYGQDWVTAASRGPRIRKQGDDGRYTEQLTFRDRHLLNENGSAQSRGARGGRSNATTSKSEKEVALRSRRFKQLVLDRLDAIEAKLRGSPIFNDMEAKDVEKAMGSFRWSMRETIEDPEARTLRAATKIGKGARSIMKDMPSDQSLSAKLFTAIRERGQAGLDAEIQYALYNHVLGANFTAADLQNQRALADLRHPTEWYPRPRQMHRTIHAHIGPTNSGKTYHALKRLETADNGLYAGPLRLLAHEVYTRLNAKGTMCALVTGEEQRLPPGWNDVVPGFARGEQPKGPGRVVSATVEMTSLSSGYDVAVIDEIQMLGNLDRGFAWTQALLGLQAKEIHVCGEVRALPIIKELAAAAGDKLVVHEYERLTKLEMDTASLNGSFAKLRKGDCIVTFSVVNIHALRTEVEKKTGKKAAVVYGSLPPETRAQQARLFNDPDNDYDYLIASDAVGMGLNLSIKRIIFETIHKFHGGRPYTLSVSEIRQIAGRAGRYKTSQQAIEAAENESVSAKESTASSSPHRWRKARDDKHWAALENGQNEEQARLDADEPISVTSSGEVETASDALKAMDSVETDLSTRAAFDATTVGLVTTIDAADFPLVAAALETEPPPLTFATLQPPPGIVQRFASYFPPDTPFSYIMLRLTELSNTTSRYKIYHKPDAILMADLIHGIEGLSIEDRMIFINAPASIRDASEPRGKLLREMATCIGNQRGGPLLSLKNMNLSVLDNPTAGTKTRLKELEDLHKSIVLYLWLSFRFPGVFSQRPLANYTKELVEAEIEETLRLMTFAEGEKRREQLRAKAQSRGSVTLTELDRLFREAKERRETKKGEEDHGIVRRIADIGSDEQSAEDRGEADLVEPGSESIGVDEIGVEEGESMPQDDEGVYADEAEEVEVAAKDDGVAGTAEGDVEKPTSTFSEWREKTTQPPEDGARSSNEESIATEEIKDEKEKAHG